MAGIGFVEWGAVPMTTVVGAVIRWEDGTPITAAEVRLLGVAEGSDLAHSVLTDVEGRFVFSDVPIGAYRIEASGLGVEDVAGLVEAVWAR